MRLILAMLAIMVIGLVSTSQAGQDSAFSPYVDSNGNITRPTDFREKWTYLGSWVHPEDLKSGMHNVYVNPGAVEKYKANGGKWADGTVIVKEVLSQGSGDMTTGKGVLHGEDKVLWFVMVKDAEGRFADNPKWGEGWGWAQYNADAPEKDVSADFQKDCLGCHVPAKATDWIYIDGYPVLKN